MDEKEHKTKRLETSRFSHITPKQYFTHEFNKNKKP
jgi:hypothetical protein